MKRHSRSNNPAGRPKEYAERLRTISLSLPASLIASLDQIADEAGISRQRVIVEWLHIARSLDEMGYLRTTSEYTHFGDWAKYPSKIEGCTNSPMTYKQVAEWYARLAKGMPDAVVSEVDLFVTRDQQSPASNDAKPAVPPKLKGRGTKKKQKPRTSHRHLFGDGRRPGAMMCQTECFATPARRGITPRCAFGTESKSIPRRADDDEATSQPHEEWVAGCGVTQTVTPDTSVTGPNAPASAPATDAPAGRALSVTRPAQISVDYWEPRIQECRVLLAGTDSLDFGMFVEFDARWSRIVAKLAQLKRAARGTTGRVVGGGRCLVLPGGKPNYPLSCAVSGLSALPVPQGSTG